MTERVEHFLLTVFNVGLYTSTRADRTGQVVSEASEAWMRHRLDLFDRYCFPSIAGQSCREFTWLVFVDADTPPQQRAALEAYEAWPNLRLVSAPPGAATRDRGLFGAEAVAQRADPAADYVITSRLDNDDALHRDYMGLVRSEIPRRHRAMLGFPNGLCLDGGRLLARHYPRNPFPSMIERPGSPGPHRGLLTVWSGEHDRVHLLASEFRQAATGPMWLQVVHERNLLNRPRGDDVPLTCEVLAPFLPAAVIADHAALAAAGPCGAAAGAGQSRSGP